MKNFKFQLHFFRKQSMDENFQKDFIIKRIRWWLKLQNLAVIVLNQIAYNVDSKTYQKIKRLFIPNTSLQIPITQTFINHLCVTRKWLVFCWTKWEENRSKLVDLISIWKNLSETSTCCEGTLGEIIFGSYSWGDPKIFRETA